MGLFWRTSPKPVSREQAEKILRRADVQANLREAGIDPAILEQELEYGELRLIGGRTTISINATMQQLEAFPPPHSDEDDPFESGTL